MSNEPTPAAVIQSALNKAENLEGSLATAHNQLEELIPESSGQDAAAYEAGLLGTLNHCLSQIGRVNERLIELSEIVGLVRP